MSPADETVALYLETPQPGASIVPDAVLPVISSVIDLMPLTPEDAPPAIAPPEYLPSKGPLDAAALGCDVEDEAGADDAGTAVEAAVARRAFASSSAFFCSSCFEIAGAASFSSASCCIAVRNPVAGWLRAFCHAAIMSRERGPKIPSVPRVSKPSALSVSCTRSRAG